MCQCPVLWPRWRQSPWLSRSRSRSSPWTARAIALDPGSASFSTVLQLAGERRLALDDPVDRWLPGLLPRGRQITYGLGLAVFPTPCGSAWGRTGNVDGTIVVAWNTRDAKRQLVLVVNTYPLSPDLERAVRRLQDEAFCAA